MKTKWNKNKEGNSFEFLPENEVERDLVIDLESVLMFGGAITVDPKGEKRIEYRVPEPAEGDVGTI